MADLPSISRRQALATVGTAVTGVGGYVVGVRSADRAPDWLAGRECAPSPLVTSRTEWPFARHDRANTGHAPARAGPDWPLEKVWEREWPIDNLYQLKSFIVADGIIVALLEADPENILLARSLDDGHVRWRRSVDDVHRGQMCAASGVVFVQCEIPDSSVRFAARSLGDGTALWTDTVSTTVSHTLAGGRLLTVDRFLDRPHNDNDFAITAFDARTGVECWRAVHGGVPGDIGVTKGRIILPTRDRGVLAVDPTTGDQQWRSAAGGDTAAIVDDLVISSRFADELKALSLTDGSIEWHVQSEYFLEGGESSDGTRYARPGFEVGAVTSDIVVYLLDVFSDYPERLQARDLENGELLWDVGPDPTPVQSHSYSRPVVVGDDVLAVRHARRKENEEIPDALLRFDVTTGTERNRVSFATDEWVYPPVVADNMLLVPTGERLVAYT